MSHIYVHIPFCKQRCTYCDFFSSTAHTKQEKYINSVCHEIKLRQNSLKDKNIQTIYFGGGTPSFISLNYIKSILDNISLYFNTQNCKEITLECNPDDLNPNFFKTLKTLPINRLSIGVQSFNDNELKLINRRHTATQAINAIKLAQSYGYNNISIDLIYALPYQTIDIWQNNLNTACSLNVQHISAYNLSYEEGCLINKHIAASATDETCEQMFKMLRKTLLEHNFEHYEISNFALSGYQSKHNKSYWENKEYLGLGCAAHSYNGDNKRWWNISDIDKYIELINKNEICYETELLTDVDKYNELILTSLRTSKGIDFNNIDNQFKDYFLINVNKFLKQRLVINENNFFKLSENGIFVSDYIIRELIK